MGQALVRYLGDLLGKDGEGAHEGGIAPNLAGPGPPGLWEDGGRGRGWWWWGGPSWPGPGWPGTRLAWAVTIKGERVGFKLTIAYHRTPLSLSLSRHDGFDDCHPPTSACGSAEDACRGAEVCGKCEAGVCCCGPHAEGG